MRDFAIQVLTDKRKMLCVRGGHLSMKQPIYQDERVRKEIKLLREEIGQIDEAINVLKRAKE